MALLLNANDKCQIEITTPIYLNSPLMADEVLKSDGSREVEWRELVLTGDEIGINKNISDVSDYLYWFDLSDVMGDDSKYIFCSHLSSVGGVPTGNTVGITYRKNTRQGVVYLNFGADIMNAQPSGNTSKGFKEYLKSEYEKGTPVTIYYQLAEPTSETVDVPAIQTLKGNTVIDVDTEVQPSNVSITYLSSGFELQPLKTADGQILYTNNNQSLSTLE